jgi:hypothetical protein
MLMAEDVREAKGGDNHKQRRADTHQHMGSQTRHPIQPLALKAHETT